MVQPSARIVYTRTDEAPLLATYSLLPVIAAYAAKAGVEVESRDISLAGRIVASWRDSQTAGGPWARVGAYMEHALRGA